MFAKWFGKKYDEWREGKYGQEGTKAAFGRYLKISSQMVGEYLDNKSRPEQADIVDKLHAVYGDEFLIALEKEPSPTDRIIYISKNLTPKGQERLLKDAEVIFANYKITELSKEDNNDRPDE